MPLDPIHQTFIPHPYTKGNKDLHRAMPRPIENQAFRPRLARPINYVHNVECHSVLIFVFFPVYQPDDWEVDLKNLLIYNSKDVATLGFGSFGKVYLGIAKELKEIPKGYKEIGCAIKVKQNGSK